ncbi:MAG TPA: type II toxin-antitoxin system prevent-host-death family antitoxin [Chloroflexota bacterium]|nr:type II toxin-antitoxin system prevent-host-death family antitoxin [Chloroflexota bacterium]
MRELKNNLSRYLVRVRAGGEVVVTVRGRAVARVTPMGSGGTLQRLITDGVVTSATTVKRPSPRDRVPVAEPVSLLVAAQRR